MAERLPLFPLDVVLLPTAPLPLHIFEERYKTMIRECLERQDAGEEGEFGVVWATDKGVARAGCSAHIIEVEKRYDDGRMDIITIGTERFNIESIDSDSHPYAQADVVFFADEDTIRPDEELRTSVVEMHKQVLKLLDSPEELQRESEAALREDDDLAFSLARMLPRDLDLKQQLLISRKPAHRLRMMREYYTKVVPQMERAQKIRSRAGQNGFSKMPH